MVIAICLAQGDKDVHQDISQMIYTISELLHGYIIIGYHNFARVESGESLSHVHQGQAEHQMDRWISTMVVFCASNCV